MTDTNKTDFNEGHIIEGCDRIHIICAMTEDHLTGHPAIIKAGCQDKIEKIQDLLAECYQAVGNLSRMVE